MKRIAVALALIVSSPVVAQGALDQGFKTLLELALDPKSHDGKTVTIRCAATNASLISTMCPVYNDAGKGVGIISAMLDGLDVSARRRLVQDCTGSAPSKKCVVDMTAVVDARNGVLLRPTAAAWVDVQ